jgi:hypothetical protein
MLSRHQKLPLVSDNVKLKLDGMQAAVARANPCLFELFSMVTLLATQQGQRARTAVLVDIWYRKSRPTFADALAAVRRAIWREIGLLTSRHRHKAPEPSHTLQRCLAYTLCQAA